MKNKTKRLLASFHIFTFLFSQYAPLLVPAIYAATSPWTQTNWSGGTGQTSWSDTTKFSTSSTTDVTTTAGEVTLTNTEELSNTDFETDLTSWDTPDYTTTLQGTQADNLMAHYPMNETSGSVATATNVATATGRDIVINRGFSTDTIWTKGTGWTIASGVASSDGTQAGNTDLTQAIDFRQSGSYEVIFTVSNYSAGNVTAVVGETEGTDRAANGTFTETIVAAAGTDFDIRADLNFVGDIDNVSVTQKNIAASSSFPGSEELADGDMEASGVGAWTVKSDATLTKETGTRTGGSGTKVLRLARSITTNPGGWQEAGSTGKRYQLTGWAKSDGNATPRIVNWTTVLWTGTNNTSWQFFDFEFTNGSVPRVLMESITSVGTEYTEWDDISLTEVNPLNGNNNGAIIGQTGMGDGQTAYSFDGTNDYINIYSPELNSNLNPDTGTLLAWAKVSGVGVWEDGSPRKIISLRVNATNEISIGKPSGNNSLFFSYIGDGVSKNITQAGLTTTDSFLIALTWDTSEDELKAYINGSQVSTTKNGIGSWIGNLQSTGSLIGAFTNTPLLVWDGSIAHTALYNTALTPTEIASLYSNVVTSSRDTGTTYSSSAGSAKIIAATDSKFTQSVNVGDTNTYNLSAYAYTDGSAVTSTDAELYYNGSTVTTTYTDQGSGWYKLSGTITGANASREYGVQVKSGVTAYVDDFSLNSYASSGSITSSIFNTEETSNQWGALTYSATTPTGTTVSVKARTSNDSDMTGATAFASCSAITSGSDMTSNDCVTDLHKYIQYKVTFTSTDNSITPTLTEISLPFSQAATATNLESPGNNSYTNNERPLFKFKTGVDASTTITSYTVEVDNGETGDFNISGIPISRTSNYETSKYLVLYQGFDDSDNTNNYISVHTKSSDDWPDTENDGKMKEGKRSWTVKAIGNTGLDYKGSRTLFVDRTGPSTEISQINSTSYSDNLATTDTTPTIFGKVVDSLSGNTSSNDSQIVLDNKVASSPKELSVKIEKKDFSGLYSLHSLSTVNLTSDYWTSTGDEIKDNSLQHPPNSNNSESGGKYSTFSYTPSEALEWGNYRVTITGKDEVGNGGSSKVFNLIIGSTQSIITPEELIVIEDIIDEELADLDLPEEEKEELKQELVDEVLEDFVKEVEPEKTSFLKETSTNIAQGLSKIYWGIIDGTKFVGKSIGSGISNTTNFISKGFKFTGNNIASLFNKLHIPTFSMPGKQLASNISNSWQQSGVRSWWDKQRIKVVVTAEVWFDKESTHISNVKIAKIGSDFAIITWNTNHHTTNNKVNYGTDLSYGQDVIDKTRSLSHQITIPNLEPGQSYVFEVMSEGKNYVYDAHHEFKTLDK